jgi:hypothetical protein
MSLVMISVIALILGSTADGWSTNRAIKRGAHEADKLAAFVFGSTVPTPATVYLRGGAIIGLEAALALTLGHFWPHVGFGIAIALCAQAGVHAFETIRTLRRY